MQIRTALNFARRALTTRVPNINSLTLVSEPQVGLAGGEEFLAVLLGVYSPDTIFIAQ
jgi:hypothetical protein